MARSSPPPPEGLGLRDGLHVLAVGVHEERGIPELCARLDDSLQVALLRLGLQDEARHITLMQAWSIAAQLFMRTQVRGMC